MSIKLMVDVFNNADPWLSHGRRLVMLALADNANDECVCWPSYTTIARKAGLSRGSTIKITSELIERGYVSKRAEYNDGEQTSNTYTINRDRLTQSDFKTTQSDFETTPSLKIVPPQSQNVTPPVLKHDPEPSFNHQLNTTGNNVSADFHEPDKGKLSGTITPERAWDMALHQWEMDIPKAAYKHYVEGARFLSWDGEDIVIQTDTQYARDWLASRMASSAKRLMSGLLGTNVNDVRFVEVDHGT